VCEVSGLSPRVSVFLAACLVPLAFGATQLALGSPADLSRAALGKGPYAWGLAAALMITLAELSAFQLTNQRVIPGLPCAELDTRGITPNIAFKKGYHFTERLDWLSRHIPVWEKALEGYKGRPDVRYLEIGLFEGRSALWMLENVLTHPTARLTGIDPFTDPHYTGLTPETYKDVFYSNLKLSGFEGKAEIIEGFSQVELRKLPLGSFDIIYIDGSHNSADALEDAILSWRLLKDGGLLIFDDYILHAGLKRTVDTFFATFADRFEPVHAGWQVFLRKKPAGESSPGPWR
jgi:SAM-dependent methyltransferase